MGSPDQAIRRSCSGIGKSRFRGVFPIRVRSEFWRFEYEIIEYEYEYDIIVYEYDIIVYEYDSWSSKPDDLSRRYT